MAFKIKVKRNSSAPATGALDAGEFGYNTSTTIPYIGNGTGNAATEIISNSSTAQTKVGAFTTQGKLGGEFLELETLTGTSPTVGQLTYDTDAGTFRAGLFGNYVLELGEKSVYFIENVTGSTIPKGSVVGFAGASGDHLRGAPFLADSSANPDYIMGIADQSIANNAFGFVVHFGKIRGIDTSAYTPGTILYASPSSAGNFTSTEPASPNLRLPVGAVVKQNASSGIIQTRIKTGERLGNLHDVTISSPNNGHILMYDNVQARWENNTITEGGAIDITNGAGTITIAHEDTSSQASVNNSGVDYIQDVTLDTYGHVTGLTSATIRDASASVSGLVNTTTQTFAGDKTFNNQIELSRANSATTGAGQIFLDGSNGNRIDWNTEGVSTPSFTTRSVGTKLTLYPTLSGSAVDYAIGINSGVLWNSIPANDGGQYFKWYGGQTEVASLSGTGIFTATRLISNQATGTSPLAVTSTTVVDNLNADTVDGLHSTSLVQTTGDQSIAGTKTFSGDKIVLGNSSGDEGGEILFTKPQTNTTIAGTGVTVDVYQNRLRFFEQGGDARGFYLDITSGGNGVSTNLASGGGTVTSVASGNGMNFTTITGSGTVTMGTPSSLTDATTNSASGTTHTHAITNYALSGTTNVLSVTGSGKVLGAATTLNLIAGHGDTVNPYASKTANNFLAAPNGSSGAPTFRAIVAADIPTLNQNTTGNAATVTNGIYTTSSSGQTITVSNGNGLEVVGGSSGSAYALYGRAGAFSRSVGVIANGYGSGDSWGLAVTRGNTDGTTDDGLNSDHLRFRGTRNNIGSNRYIAILPASLAATRTYTLPDAGADANFVMTEGTQTINGAKTFSDFTLSATEVAIASGDHLVITDNSDSDKIKDATLTFGTDINRVLLNNGTWGTLGVGITSDVNVSATANTYTTAMTTSTLDVGTYNIQFNGAFFKTNATSGAFTLTARFTNAGFGRMTGAGYYSITENSTTFVNFYLNHDSATDGAAGAGFTTVALGATRANAMIQFSAMVYISSATTIQIRIAGGVNSSGLGLEQGSNFSIIRVA
jgi:hypothetical protein